MRLLSHNRVELATILPSMQLSQDPALEVVPFLRATEKSEEIRMPGQAVLAWDGADGNKAAGPASASPSNFMLIGLGLATWMEFYTYDGVNLVLPDMAGTLGLSQDKASWILTIYLSALLFGVPLSIWMARHVGYRRYIIGEHGGLCRGFGRLRCSARPCDASVLAGGSGLCRRRAHDVVARERLHAHASTCARRVDDAPFRRAVSGNCHRSDFLRLRHG
jgi:hypothetical protein